MTANMWGPCQGATVPSGLRLASLNSEGWWQEQGLAWEQGLHTALPTHQGPTSAGTDVSSSTPAVCASPTPKCSQCFEDTFPHWHGHTPVMSASGCTCGLGALSPCAKRTPRSCSCLESVGPYGAAAIPLLAVLALPIPLYHQVPHRARGTSHLWHPYKKSPPASPGLWFLPRAL